MKVKQGDPAGGSNPVTYETTIEFSDQGIPLVETLPGARLNVKDLGGDFVITGNRNGLLFLARQLMGLAHIPEALEAEGYHIHIDDSLYDINGEGINVVIELEG